jgi:hypothetical protein
MKSVSPSRYLNLLREKEDRSSSKYIPGFDTNNIGKVLSMEGETCTYL